MYDLKIQGGTIVDGMNASRFAGDVGIKDGKVVALGVAPLGAATTIDATGQIVCPGFVDIHTHYDAQILWDPMVSCSPWHGVTTVVMGNCGFSVAPTRPAHRDLIMRTLENVEGMSVDALRAGLTHDWSFETFPEYLDAIEDRGCAVNVAAMLGHTALRMYVMGEDAVTREATPDEIEAQRRILDEGLAAGALGFATSKSHVHAGYDGHPVPSRLATVDEIIEIASALAGHDHGVVQATSGRELSHDEFAAIAERTGKTVSWTALMSDRPGYDHRADLAKAASLVEHGFPVFPQVSVQPLQFEAGFEQPFQYAMLPCFNSVMQADREQRKVIYADPDWRDQFKEKAGAGGSMADRWARTTISYHPSDVSLEGRNVQQLADERGCDPVDLLLDLALAADLKLRYTQDLVNYTLDSVEELLSDPNTVIGLSDAGAHAGQLCDAKYSTEFLSTFVRERGSFTLEAGIHMLTQRPAQVFGIADRGTLEVGKPADVVVFDANEVGHLGKRRVHDLPGGADRIVSDATGISAVVVNGIVIRQHNVDQVTATGPLPGRLLRHGRA